MHRPAQILSPKKTSAAGSKLSIEQTGEMLTPSPSLGSSIGTKHSTSNPVGEKPAKRTKSINVDPNSTCVSIINKNHATSTQNTQIVTHTTHTLDYTPDSFQADLVPPLVAGKPAFSSVHQGTGLYGASPKNSFDRPGSRTQQGSSVRQYVSLESRLQATWLRIPHGLEDAPFPVLWEI
ncbi:hypothetical protein BX600DRAFT_207062 [Xylariales sp. PMI_506]|nr:hypothetical protein BX600DRAFT_207062 [Xylariales sp. PMI_506]